MNDNCVSPACQADQRITGAVQSRIDRYSALRGDHLQIETRDRVVYLRGLVDTAREHDLVEELAAQTEGVLKVVNMTAMISRGPG